MVFDNRFFKIDDKRIRITYDFMKDKWLCEIGHVISVLTDTKNYQETEKYWENLREKVSNESGKQIDKYKLIYIEELPQFLKFIPGSKTDQFRLWLKQFCKDTADADACFAKWMEYYHNEQNEFRKELDSFQSFAQQVEYGKNRRNRYDEEAFKQLYKAAELGKIEAQYYLSIYYFEQNHGAKPNQEKAFEWALKAAEHGHESAQQFLGNCYYYGTGVEQNFDKAYFWYSVASDNGHAGLYRQGK